MQSCCGSGYERWATKSLTVIIRVYEDGVALLQDRLFAVLGSASPATALLSAVLASSRALARPQQLLLLAVVASTRPATALSSASLAAEVTLPYGRRALAVDLP
jgi:hypothetical protein